MGYIKIGSRKISPWKSPTRKIPTHQTPPGEFPPGIFPPISLIRKYKNLFLASPFFSFINEGGAGSIHTPPF